VQPVHDLSLAESTFAEVEAVESWSPGTLALVKSGRFDGGLNTPAPALCGVLAE
jgi:hypothetical protein